MPVKCEACGHPATRVDYEYVTYCSAPIINDIGEIDEPNIIEHETSGMQCIKYRCDKCG